MIRGRDPGMEFHGTERFEIRRQLGRGGMGQMYEAFDRERGVAVALKTLFNVDAGGIYQFKKEFRALADLHHRNLVRLYELFQDGDRWFFTMELVRGTDFLQHVRAGAGEDATEPADASADTLRDATPGALVNEARLRDALAQLATGVSTLHRANMAHRDIKPSNTMVTTDARTVLLDFGLVAELGNDSFTNAHAAGTALYMAPEQAGAKPVGAPADWYSVGCVLYEALTGRPPFVGRPLEVLVEKQRRAPPPPRALNGAVPPDLDALCVDLLQIDPLDRPPVDEILARLGIGGGPRSRWSHIQQTLHAEGSPFVGREAELAFLRAAYQDGRAGNTVTVLVHGESGIGKSSLVRHSLEQLAARDAGALVLSSRCYERESLAFKAFDGIVDGLSRHLCRLDQLDVAVRLPEDAALATRIFPVLRRVPAISRVPDRGGDIPNPQQLRSRAFAALRKLLAGCADGKPLVLFIDDLQWADVDSLSLLHDLVRAEDGPALVVATMRTSGGVPDAAMLPGARHLQLLPLAPSEARSLVQLLDREAEASAAAISEEARGHPLFIQELVRFRMSGAAPHHGSVRLDEVLQARIAELPEDHRRLLEVIAVAGTLISLRVAAHAAELGPAEASKAVVQLRNDNLVRSTWARESDDVDLFHDRVREVVLAHLPAETRRRHHRRLAEALEKITPAAFDALALHWREADDSARAAQFAMLGGHQAAEALAFDRAALLYRLALQLRPLEGDAASEVQARLAAALANAGRGLEASREYFAAAAAASQGEQKTELRWRAAQQLLLSGHIDDGLAEIETVLAGEGVELAPTVGRAVASLIYHRARLRLRGLRFQLRDASDLPPSLLKSIDLRFSVAKGLAWVDVLRAAEFQSRLVRAALDAGEPRRLAYALALEAGFASGSGGHRRAAELLKMAEALARELEDPLGLGMVFSAAGFDALTRQSYVECRDFNSRAENILAERCVGAHWELTLTRVNLLFAIGLLGDVPDLVSRGERYVKEAEERGDLFAATSLTCGPLALVPLAADDPDGARRANKEALGRWSQRGFHLQHFYALAMNTQVDLYERRPDAAYRRIADALPDFRRASFWRLQVLRTWMLDIQCRVAIQLAQRSSDATRERLIGELSRLARRLQRERLPSAVAQAAYARGSVAMLRGDEQQAVAGIDEAIRRYEADHMALVAASLRWHRARMTGGDSAAIEREIAARGIRAPVRFVGMVAPFPVD